MERLSAVCVGESMAVLVPAVPGPLEDVAVFHRSMGGAESNVARGLVALGVPAAWVSRVGDDGFGRHVRAAVAAAGVDTGAVAIDPVRPTGLYVKETADDVTIPRYYRAGAGTVERVFPARLACSPVYPTSALLTLRCRAMPTEVTDAT